MLWRAYACLAPEPADLLPDSVTATADQEFDFPTTLAAHLGAAVLDGNDVRLLLNGVEIFPPMLAAIDSARTTVNFLTYVYWTGEIAERFAGSLAAAAERGVEVRVLLDAYGAHQIDPAMVERMESAGADVAWFHPVDWFNFRRVNHRTHRKVLVVDGAVAFTGGVGIAEEWTGDARSPDEWRDDHFELRGPVVTYLQGAFAENWLQATGEVLTGVDHYPVQSPAGDARVIPIITSPRGDMSPIAFSYWLALRYADRSVDISTPYFVPDESLLTSLEETARRGVRVRILLPGSQNDSRLVRWASLSRYEGLLDAGVEIHEFQPTMIHTKAMVVDDRWSVIGSANFDNRSFELNDEIVVFVDDPALNASLRLSMDADLERADRVTGDGFEGIGLFQRLAGYLSLLLREQL